MRYVSLKNEIQIASILIDSVSQNIPSHLNSRPMDLPACQLFLRAVPEHLTLSRPKTDCCLGPLLPSSLIFPVSVKDPPSAWLKPKPSVIAIYFPSAPQRHCFLRCCRVPPSNYFSDPPMSLLTNTSCPFHCNSLCLVLHLLMASAHHGGSNLSQMRIWMLSPLMKPRFFPLSLGCIWKAFIWHVKSCMTQPLCHLSNLSAIPPFCPLFQMREVLPVRKLAFCPSQRTYLPRKASFSPCFPE